jgi:hypothetical protein
MGGSIVRGTGRAGIATLDAVLNSRLAGDVVERVAASPLAARAVHGALRGPLVDALATDLVRVLEEEEFDYVVQAILESDDLWLIVDEIASSPAVTTAIAQQSVSFADQVAGGVRSRSRNADAWLEGRARRAFRRSRTQPPGSGTG